MISEVIDAIVTRLSDASLGVPVYAERVNPVDGSCVIVHTGGDDVEEEYRDESGYILEHQVLVSVYFKDTTGEDRSGFHSLVNAVKAPLAVYRDTMEGTAYRFKYQGSVMVPPSNDNASEIYRIIQLRYSATTQEVLSE